MQIVIRASEVAAAIGLNQYKSRQEVRDELWKKYKPETFTGKTKLDRANEALGASFEARQVLAQALSIKAKDSSEAVHVFENAKNIVHSDPKLNDEQKKEVIEHLRSKVYTTHGTRSEDKTSDKVTEDTGARLVKDNAFYSLSLCTLGDLNFVIRGKIDRIEEKPDGSRVLVEIKNRTNRLFRRVVDYENVQIQVYLQMLGLVHARLVEQHNTQVLSHVVDRDEEFWANVILPKLGEFCSELHECLTK